MYGKGNINYKQNLLKRGEFQPKFVYRTIQSDISDISYSVYQDKWMIFKFFRFLLEFIFIKSILKDNRNEYKPRRNRSQEVLKLFSH